MKRDLKASLEEIGALLSGAGMDVRDIAVSPPASLVEVEKVENCLGREIPRTARDFFLGTSKEIKFCWFAPDELDFPVEFDEIFCGDLSLDLNGIPSLEEERLSWIENCFPNPDDDYDRVWHNKLSLLEVGDGDQIALELEEGREGEIIYLSHDGCESHGTRLATSLSGLIEEWVPIGCPGPEASQWTAFYSKESRRIDSSSPSSLEWLEFLRGIAP